MGMLTKDSDQGYEVFERDMIVTTCLIAERTSYKFCIYSPSLTPLQLLLPDEYVVSQTP